MELVRPAVFLIVLLYLQAVARSQPAGLIRFAYVLPAVAFFARLPLAVPLLTVRGGLGFICGWLSNAKLLAFTGNRGPLAHPGLSGLQFLALLLLPVYSNKHPTSSRNSSNSSNSNSASGGSTNTSATPLAETTTNNESHVSAKATAGRPARAHARPSLLASTAILALKLAVMISLTLLLTGPTVTPPFVRHAFYAVYIYLLVSIMLDSMLPAAQALMGGRDTADSGTPPLQLQQGMRAPFLAKSVKEFWGWRYNQVVSATLLDCVYQPILDGSWVMPQPDAFKPATMAARPDAPSAAGPGLQASLARPPHPARQALALTAAFLVSGIMHEIMIWYMCLSQTPPKGRLMLFFLAQPVLIWVQDGLSPPLAALCRTIKSRACKGQMQLRLADALFRGCQIVCTLLAMLVCGELWFWYSFEEGCRIDHTGLGEALDAISWVRQRLGQQI